nr:hypothetical protein [Tanacetum cinerariifolium]
AHGRVKNFALMIYIRDGLAVYPIYGFLGERIIKSAPAVIPARDPYAVTNVVDSCYSLSLTGRMCKVTKGCFYTKDYLKAEEWSKFML